MSPVLLARRARSHATLRCALLVPLALMAACRTWRAEPLPAMGSPARAIGGHVRATRADGIRVELTRARVVGDSLRGEPRGRAAGGQRSETAVPLDGLRQLEVRRVSAARTTWLGIGVLASVFLGMSAGEAEAYGPSSR
jgi:hypothetical protein